LSSPLPTNFKKFNARIKFLMCVHAIIKAMKKELMEILVCPVCKGKLKLTVEEEKGGEVISGSLHCSRCRTDYPIINSIPNLLPPELR